MGKKTRCAQELLYAARAVGKTNVRAAQTHRQITEEQPMQASTHAVAFEFDLGCRVRRAIAIRLA